MSNTTMQAQPGPNCLLCRTNSLKTEGAVCESCLRKGLRAHQQLLQRYYTSLQNSRAKAAHHLQGPRDAARRLKACIGQKVSNLELARHELERKKYACVQLRERLRAQSALIARRENLRLASEQLEDLQHRTSDPFASTSAASSRAQDIVQLRAEWQRVAAALTEARQSACLQAVDMWHLQAVDTAAPLFFDPATEAASNQKQDDGYILCQIGGCVLPPVKDLKQYPPDEITAAVGNAAYLVRLLAMYLGVRLPFALNLGDRSTIKAAPFTVWQERYPNSQPLYISASAVKQAAEHTTFSSAAASGRSAFVSNSSKTETPTTDISPASRALAPFVTALSMLTYDIYFLACTALRLPLTSELQAAGPLHVLLTAITQFSQQPESQHASHASAEKELSRRSRSHASAYRPLAELNLVIGGATPVATTTQAVSTFIPNNMVLGFPDLLTNHLETLSKTTRARPSKQTVLRPPAVTKAEVSKPSSQTANRTMAAASDRPAEEHEDVEDWDLV